MPHLPLLFILPDIHERPTGGNVYNRRLIQALQTRIPVDTLVIEGDAQDLHEERGSIESYRNVVVDSLLIDRIVPVGRNDVSWHVLTHYLPFFDPNRTDAEVNLDVLARFDGFITTSRYSAACLERIGLKKKQIHVVYPGLDASYRTKLPAQVHAGSCRLLTVASLLPGKGLLEGMEILEKMPDLDWRWVVAGDDTLDRQFARRFRDRIQASSCRQRIEWVGTVDAEVLPVWYQNHDALISFSRFETLGMAIREAMACGLPVVGYDVGGVSESFEAGGGLLIPAFDEGGFLNALRRLVTDASLREDLGKKALQSAAAFPGWEETAARFYDYFFA